MRGFGAAMSTIGIGTIGIFLAYAIWYLDDKGIWIDQYISAGAPIEEVMAIIVIIFLLVGVIIGAMRSK